LWCASVGRPELVILDLGRADVGGIEVTRRGLQWEMRYRSRRLAGLITCLALLGVPSAAHAQSADHNTRAAPAPDPRRGADAPPPPPPVVTPRPRQSLWERVEGAWDRGNRRVTGEPTHHVEQLRNDRDERLGRIPAQRPTEQFEEAYDRQLRLGRLAPGAAGRSPSVSGRVDPLPRVSADPETASMAWMLEEDQRLLAKLKADYERQAGEAARRHEQDREAAKSEAERAALDRRYVQERSESTRKYENQRRAILGWPPDRPAARPATRATEVPRGVSAPYAQ
jgi:hypothetical protein